MASTRRSTANIHPLYPAHCCLLEPRLGIGFKPSLSKARHWAQRALEAAPNAKKKAKAATLLADIQDKQAHFSDSAWAATVQAEFERMQDVGTGEALVDQHMGRLCIVCLHN
jgi:hypothetical protein